MEGLKLIRASLPTNIEIRQNVIAANSKILGDATQIHQVFMNLCANAEHAMRKNGGILNVVLSTVEFSPADHERPPDLNPGAYGMLSVGDTGYGIPPSVIDLVITDQTMPGMTGDQLALKLLALRPDMPIILSTGFSHVIDEARAKSIGIRDVIMKPVARKELAAAVRRVLDQSRNRR